MGTVERLDCPDFFFSWVYATGPLSFLLSSSSSVTPSLTAQACAELWWTWLPLLGAFEANSSIPVLDVSWLRNNQFIFPSLSLVR